MCNNCFIIITLPLITSQTKYLTKSGFNPGPVKKLLVRQSTGNVQPFRDNTRGGRGGGFEDNKYFHHLAGHFLPSACPQTVAHQSQSAQFLVKLTLIIDYLISKPCLLQVLNIFYCSPSHRTVIGPNVHQIIVIKWYVQVSKMRITVIHFVICTSWLTSYLCFGQKCKNAKFAKQK